MRTERSQPGVHIEVGVRQLREELKAWIDRVQAGDEIIVTERGTPVARLVPAGRSSALQRLIDEGRATAPRRPRPRRTAADLIKVRAPVSDLLQEQKR